MQWSYQWTVTETAGCDKRVKKYINTFSLADEETRPVNPPRPPRFIAAAWLVARLGKFQSNVMTFSQTSTVTRSLLTATSSVSNVMTRPDTRLDGRRVVLSCLSEYTPPKHTQGMAPSSTLKLHGLGTGGAHRQSRADDKLLNQPPPHHPSQYHLLTFSELFIVDICTVSNSFNTYCTIFCCQDDRGLKASIMLSA